MTETQINLVKTSWNLNDIKGLAQRHNKYGAKPEHYAVVGECLLWTLEKGLGDKWNNELKEAWTTVYGVLANAMIANQEQKPAAA
jgi:hemoglobin-like flavoprotein